MRDESERDQNIFLPPMLANSTLFMVKYLCFSKTFRGIQIISEGTFAMDEYERHHKLWQLLQHLRVFIIPAFRFEYEPIKVESPFLLIVNHVTACDPLLVGIALEKRQAYFVASDHVLRQGIAGWLIRRCFGPIPRRKGASGLMTVRECMRHLREGHSICIFAEGEQSWDGRSIPVVEGTGSLALASRVPLVTYRLEGGYLSLPRWGKGLRRGRVRGRITGVYSPEDLAAMGKKNINRLLNEGIQENAWERQAIEKTCFRGKHAAEHLEKCLYLCPGCSRVGTLISKGDRLSCGCGFQVRYTETGAFEPASPFPTLAEWEDWQKDRLRRREFKRPSEDGLLFADAGVSLSQVNENNRVLPLLSKAEMRLYEDRLACGNREFPLNGIRDMAMTQANRLLFTFADGYYEIHSVGRTNLRKYLEIWKHQSMNGRP